MKFYLLPLLFVLSTLAGGHIQGDLPPGFDVEGHRGARGLKPENTLPAFEIALDMGVTTLELDLHFTSDNVVVIWHDDTITGDKCWLDPDAGVNTPDPNSLVFQGDRLMINQLTVEQVQAYQCDRNPEPNRFPDQNNAGTPLAGDDFRIVSLEALFEFVEAYMESGDKTDTQRENASQVRFNIETKRKVETPKAINDGFDGVNPGPFELAILDLINQADLHDRVVVQSFDHRSLWAIHSVDDSIALAALTDRIIPDLETLASQGATIWSPNFHDLSPGLVEKAHQEGLLVIPWTVNDRNEMRAMIDMDVDGIISDRPDFLLDLRSDE